jgi:hypothetical protein
VFTGFGLGDEVGRIARRQQSKAGLEDSQQKSGNHDEGDDSKDPKTPVAHLRSVRPFWLALCD